MRGDSPSDGANRAAAALQEALGGLPEGREPEALGINRPRYTSGQSAAEGVYRVGDRVFRVVTKAGKTHAVAEEMIRGKFVYAKGWVFRLKPSQRLTLEEAKAWGRAEIRCIRCGIELTKPESREAGIGPVCATKI